MSETQTIEDFATAVGKTFCWHELYTPDGEASVKFYTECLGWGTKAMEMGEMGTYNMLTVDGQALAGMMQTTGTPGMENVPPHWSIYVTVDDVDARLAKCLENGATNLVPPMDVPTVGRMALVQDPQGATFWLFKPAPQG
jgi:predicted enzyme related to lactoylglutathione lyase